MLLVCQQDRHYNTLAASATRATNVAVGYAASEAAATVEIGGGMSGVLTTTKVPIYH